MCIILATRHLLVKYALLHVYLVADRPWGSFVIWCCCSSQVTVSYTTLTFCLKNMHHNMDPEFFFLLLYLHTSSMRMQEEDWNSTFWPRVHTTCGYRRNHDFKSHHIKAIVDGTFLGYFHKIVMDNPKERHSQHPLNGTLNQIMRRACFTDLFPPKSEIGVDLVY